MPYQLKFIANKLDGALKDMASRHLTTYECARYDYGEVLDSFINRMEAAQKGLCRGTECQVRNSELELLIHSLKRISSGNLQASLLCILEKRAKKRLFELNWYMLQEDYTNAGLLASMNVLCTYMKRNHPDEFAATLFSRLGSPDENFLGNSLDLAMKEYDGIEEFLNRYNIMPLSTFGGRLCLEYYTKCGKQGFIADREMFYLFLDNYCDEEVYPAVANYLDSLDTVEYPDRINMLLLNRFSDPASSNCLWDNVSNVLKQKFTQWMRLKEIEEHYLIQVLFIGWVQQDRHVYRYEFFKAFLSWLLQGGLGRFEKICVIEPDHTRLHVKGVIQA